MKRLISIIAILALFATTSFAADQSFSGVKVADAKGHQTDARLFFNDTAKTVTIKVADKDFLSIPYENIDKVSYEYTKKHRITQGAVVMVASLGAGAIVMLTKSKSHWLYIDYHEQTTSRSVVLRMDKKEYDNIISAASIHLAKNVEGYNDNKPVNIQAANKKASTPAPTEKPAQPKSEGLVEAK